MGSTLFLTKSSKSFKTLFPSKSSKSCFPLAKSAIIASTSPATAEVSVTPYFTYSLNFSLRISYS